MKLPVTIHQARLGASEFKVIRPARPLRHAALLDHDRYLDCYLDQDAARCIGALWALAATSPRALIHLPMRTNRLPSATLSAADGRPLDLLLLHHTLQFAPARWKELRARLGPGRPRTVTLQAPPAVDSIDFEARHHRENRDVFHQHLHAETLFMTGSAKLFRETARHFLDLAQDGPGHAAAHPSSSHFCTEFHGTDGTLAPTARQLHIEYCEEWPD
ncbi:hypothetical protein ABT095_00795 [Kitasatospora sp. NPDC002227]|uniref:hypothetical protein n=1 Tax=Kitasatospora sp. NPDC002227 TaxID=3154773 RepID=UPI00331EE164